LGAKAWLAIDFSTRLPAESGISDSSRLNGNFVLTEAHRARLGDPVVDVGVLEPCVLLLRGLGGVDVVVLRDVRAGVELELVLDVLAPGVALEHEPRARHAEVGAVATVGLAVAIGEAGLQPAAQVERPLSVGGTEVELARLAAAHLHVGRRQPLQAGLDERDLVALGIRALARQRQQLLVVGVGDQPLLAQHVEQGELEVRAVGLGLAGRRRLGAGGLLLSGLLILLSSQRWRGQRQRAGHEDQEQDRSRRGTLHPSAPRCRRGDARIATRVPSPWRVIRALSRRVPRPRRAE
jgi:hypothetical protein